MIKCLQILSVTSFTFGYGICILFFTFFISNSIFDPLSLRFSKITATLITLPNLA